MEDDNSGAKRQEQPTQEAAVERVETSQPEIFSGYEDVDFCTTECTEPREGDHEDDDDDEDESEEEDDDEEEDEEENEDGSEGGSNIGKEEEEEGVVGEKGENKSEKKEFMEGENEDTAETEKEEQTAQELARKNRLAQTGYDVRALDTMGWTARYQAVMARPKNTAHERMVCAVEERRLFDEFSAHAARIAQRLVHEINLPTSEKTIKPINSGGVAGGESLFRSHTCQTHITSCCNM